MAETGESTTTGSGGGGQGQNYLPWHLIPVFKPGSTDLTEYSRKIEFLAQIWPPEHLPALAPRAALLCEGSAFQKVIRLDASKLKTPDLTGVKLLVKTLGGVWGKTTLENKYETFERIIYGTSQKNDETNESYLARHEVLFEDVINQGANIADMRAYILLRNSALGAEDKKKVIVESGGTLQYDQVVSAIRMLGSKFFQDVHGSKNTGRSKTYEVNFQDVDEEVFATEENYFDGWEVTESVENTVDILLSEGDEDAAVVSQFEDVLLETIQNNEELASFMNTYVEARRRLVEKTKNRGFWTSTPKGKGKGKSKQKGKGRRPLAQRIAESSCRRCGQRGHWKAECPLRDKAPPSGSFPGQSQQVANTLIPENDKETEEDIIFDEHLTFRSDGTPDLSSHEALVVHQVREAGLKRDNRNYEYVNGVHKHNLQGFLGRLCHSPNTGYTSEKITSLNRSETRANHDGCTTPSDTSGCVKNMMISSGDNLSKIHSPLINQRLNPSLPEEHPSFFASYQAYGIVDLGASQTVMGQHQVHEFLESLPPHTRARVYEGPANMTFRFGNNGTVACSKAIFVPISKIWMKIAIVQSQTPFLISNSVFRNLNAIVDTGNQQIEFRKLGCTVPVRLSERKLFLLDIKELIEKAEDPNAVSSGSVKSETILHSHRVDDHEIEQKKEIQNTSPHDIDKEVEVQTHALQNHSVSLPRSSRPEIHPTSDPSFVKDPSSFVSHGFGRFSTGHTLREDASDQNSGSRHGQAEGNALQGTSGTHHQVWRGQTWTALPPGSPRRSSLLSVVPEELRQVPKGNPPGVCLLPPCLHREDGKPGEHAREQARSQVQGAWEGCFIQGKSEGTIHERRGRLGSNRRRSTTRSGDTLPHQPTRADDAANDDSGAGSDHGCSARDETIRTMSAELRQFLAVCHEEIQGNILREGNHERYHGDKHQPPTNWVADEMWKYFQQKGYSQYHLGKNSRCDLVEVYCSHNSQLTRQCIRNHGKAYRFGLSQGDLTHYENRCKLYDLIFHTLPENIWMSPSCKAWNKWSQFNAARSSEMARKVMQARIDDEVHLFLCAALFEFQRSRRTACHFHLEQPTGSDMLYDDILQEVWDLTHHSRCDMCVAGQLSHPQSKKPLKKSTQILTTSKILCRVLDKLQCPRNHNHDHVAGSFRNAEGRHQHVSQYTELYTARFAQNVCRAFQASAKVGEKNVLSDHAFALTGNSADAEDQPLKRRRLGEKCPRPPAYEKSEEKPEVPPIEIVPQDIPDKEVIIQKCQEVAPRVGRIVLEGGECFQVLEKAFPEHHIRVVEICKGTDRYRKPPVRLVKNEAPLRKYLGVHRQSQEIFESNEWEAWESWSNRKLVEKGQPARMLITIFGRLKEEEKQPREDRKREGTEIRTEPHKKPRQCSEELYREILGEPNGDNTIKTTEISQEPEKNPIDILKDHHGEKFTTLSKEEQQWIRKIHTNLGHPGTQKLRNLLQSQGYPKHLVDAVADYKCSTCHELQLPRRARPASLTNEEREFNDVVGCDIIKWTSSKGKQYQFLHFIDSATNFHQAVSIFRSDAEGLFTCFQQAWLHWAGPCRQLIIDNESALCSEQFVAKAQEMSILVKVVAAYAHWQLGKTERHGDILQHMLQKYDHEVNIENEDQFQSALIQCCNAKNSLARHKGYTPEILVLGKSQILPGSNSQDELDASQYTAVTNSPEGIAFRQQLFRRECARKAFVEMDNSDKIRRALLRKSCPHRGQFMGGTLVMYWRPGRGENPGTWHGPAQVIVQETNNVVWLSHASRVYRVAPEHIRSLSEREQHSYIHQVRHNPREDDQSMRGQGVFQYHDLVVNSNPEIPNPIEHPTPGPVESPPEGDVVSINSQPDAEPGVLPGSNISEGYVPSTPHSLVPDEDLPDGIQIPVPSESEGDELVMEDYWVIQDNQAIRVHNRPRNQLFSPWEDPECPLNVLTVLGERTTMRKPLKETIVIQENDRWDEKNQESKSYENEWIGVTTFNLIKEETLPETEEVYHVEPGQYWECALTLTHQELIQTMDPSCDITVLLASAAKRQRAEVKLKDLTPEQVQEFEMAKIKEVNQWLDTGTVRAILRNRIPESNILRSRWILTWKEIDDIEAAQLGQDRKAKARLVVLGFEDPDLTEIPRDSPTLQKESRSLIFQYCASRQWQIQSFDIKTAFLRGSKRDDRVLGVEPPIELRKKMGLTDNQVCELLKSAYGLVNAPYLWYQELKESLIALDFKMSPLDPCLFSLIGKDRKVHGVLGVHVDDGLCAGDHEFERVLKRLEEKFPFGSKRRTSFVFTGIQVNQDEKGRIHLDQKDYVNRIDPIQIERNRRKQENETVVDKEKQDLRGIIGSLQYAATNTRPDLSARLSLLQARINCATIRDLLEANRLLSDAKKHGDTRVTYEPIPIEDLRFIVYSDASFASREKQQSQKGGIILAAHQQVMNQQPAGASPIVWYSKKISRVVASTLAAETFALSHAIDLLDWIRLSWEWILNPEIPWKEPEKVWKHSHPSIAVTDCKSLYDVIVKNATPQCQEHRTLVEALVIKDHVQNGTRMHWVHSAAQLADTLTKHMDSSSLRDFLTHRQCCLHDVHQILKERADRKAQKSWLHTTTQTTNHQEGPNQNLKKV